MDLSTIFGVFQGVGTLFSGDPVISTARVGLMLLGMLLIYLGKKGTLEPLIMVPMGLGMIAVNAGVLLLDPQTTAYVTEQAYDPAVRVQGTLFVAPLVQQPSNLINIMGIDWLQPVYTFTFSNGLIACLVFMGIGSLLDVGYVLARPFESMIIALCAELGTVLVFPIAVSCGLNYGEAASIAMVGGADGPMVMFTSLMLAPELFVPICVVAYLYLGLTYGGYPYLLKAMIPRRLRAIKEKPPAKSKPQATKGEKLAFAVISCAVLCLLFPVAAPLFFSLFIGVAVREAEIKVFTDLISNTVLYAATFFLGLMLGVLCEASTILNPKVLLLLCLGILALLLSGIGGILGGYLIWWWRKGDYNPVVGIAGVSCVPTCAKVAQKVIAKDNPGSMVMPQALGANICGVITTAVLCGVYVSLVPHLGK